MEKLNVLVISRSVLYRKMLSDAVSNTELGVVKHNAPNISIAMEWLNQSEIHVVIMDTILLEAGEKGILQVIGRDKPRLNIILTCSGEMKNPELVVEALEMGAIDYIPKVDGVSDEANVEIIRRGLKPLFMGIQVRMKIPGMESGAISCSESGRKEGLQSGSSGTALKSEPGKRINFRKADLVLIASSTGGPVALEKVLEDLPGSFSTPVLVVQHMPPDFTRILAETLDKKSAVCVAEANDNDPVADNRIMIAPGGYHMKVAGAGRSKFVLKMEDTPMVNGVRPAADVLFHSVAEEYAGKDILVVILTGMGGDGSKGVNELKKKCNCYCMTQSESTCVVYGMPRCVFEAGLSDEVVDLDRISGRIALMAAGK
jgi:two-component system, chemotaxis family, protein-glutamate methylesterase/glutaminase